MKKLIYFLLLFWTLPCWAGLVVSAQPKSVVVPVNTKVTFTLKATSNRSIRYYWYKNGTMLDNAKTNTLTVTATEGSAATYSCLVNDGKTKFNCAPFTLSLSNLDKVGDISFKWTPPTTRKNGKELKPEEIAKYEIYTVAGVSPNYTYTPVGETTNTQIVLQGYKVGKYTFSIVTVDIYGLKSDYSDHFTTEVN